MTNEMKIIMALCDALGFEVSKVQTDASKRMQAAIDAGSTGLSSLGANGIWNHIEFEYKLTKKSPD